MNKKIMAVNGFAGADITLAINGNNIITITAAYRVKSIDSPLTQVIAGATGGGYGQSCIANTVRTHENAVAARSYLASLQHKINSMGKARARAIAEFEALGQ